jgi:hypothetical protein
MDRIEALEKMRDMVKDLDEFLNDTNPKAAITHIDPQFVKFQDLGYATEAALLWLTREVKDES